MNTYDIDGVIYMRKGLMGVRPGPKDIIITGRSTEEAPETLTMLRDNGILNKVYFNPLPFDSKSRESSGLHKAKILNELKEAGYDIQIHFEDDPIQISAIQEHAPWVKIVHMSHDLTYKENMRHV